MGDVGLALLLWVGGRVETGWNEGLGLSDQEAPSCPSPSPLPTPALGDGEAGMGPKVDVLQGLVTSGRPASTGKELGTPPHFPPPDKAEMAHEGWAGGGPKDA